MPEPLAFEHVFEYHGCMETVSKLDATALLARAAETTRSRRLAEAHDLALLLQWAEVSADAPGPLIALGGEGTPQVRDFCLGEIALARGAGVGATAHALADALDLAHRLPRCWAALLAGEVDAWIPRRVAKLSRALPLDRVELVDAAVSAMLGHESPGRVLQVAEAKVMEADLAAHQARVEAERQRRYVAVSRTDEYGLRTLIARLESGDAAWVEATVARVAEILRPEHPDTGVDELHALAFGWLARPAELLALLAAHTEPTATPGADEPLHRAVAFPADLLGALREVDLSVLAPRAVLYVHVHESALHGVDAVARVEGLGPVTLDQLQGLLGRTRLTVKPVIDLRDRVRGAAYEHPTSVKERVHLITDGDYWPWATSTSRHVDYDHVTAYEHTHGPPDQTGTHNSGPLGRRHHRYKTFAGFDARQAGAGRYAWTTPHGLGFLVDHTGTREVTWAHARAIIDAPPGLDLYPPDRCYLLPVG